MELKTAGAICLISLFSATLVVLIARSLDLQAASRLEPQLTKIVEELQAIRKSVGVAESPAGAAQSQPMEDGLVVYYFHGNTRCPTCRAIESQTFETVRADFATQLDAGQMAWKPVNYEAVPGEELAEQFGVHMSVVVLARMHRGQIADFKRLDQVWALVGDKPAFAAFIREEIEHMLGTANPPAATAAAAEAPMDDPMTAHAHQKPGDLPPAAANDLPLP